MLFLASWLAYPAKLIHSSCVRLTIGTEMAPKRDLRSRQWSCNSLKAAQKAVMRVKQEVPNNSDDESDLDDNIKAARSYTIDGCIIVNSWNKSCFQDCKSFPASSLTQEVEAQLRALKKQKQAKKD